MRCLKREKLIQTKSRLRTIPYSKVRVEWIDILSDSVVGLMRNRFNKMKLAFPVNEGWLYNKDKYAVKLFASYDRDEDGSLTFGDRTMIPLACVKKMTEDLRCFNVLPLQQSSHLVDGA